jgi:Tat protein translocase TatB subunit
MLGLGLGEILFIALVVLVVVGPDRLPHFMRTAGRVYGQFRRAADEMRRAMVLEADRQDADERYSKLQKRREQAAEDRRKAMAAAGAGAVAQSQDLPEPDEADPPVEEDADVVVDLARPDDIDDAHYTDDLPPGVTVEEWVKLPPHVREILMGRSPASHPEDGV